MPTVSQKEEKSEEEKSAKFSNFFYVCPIWYILDNQIEKLIQTSKVQIQKSFDSNDMCTEKRPD